MKMCIRTVLLFVLFCGSSHIILSQTILYETYTERAKKAFASGDMTQAEKLFKSALIEAEKLQDLGLIATGSVNLGKIYHTQERFELAESHYLRAIEIYDRLDGKDQERSAFALNNLGLLYAQQKNYDKSETILRNALSIREKILGQDDPDVAVTLLNLGKLYADQSKYVEANAVYIKALQIFIQDPEYIDEILICLHNISNSSYELKEYERAESAYKMTLGIIEKNYGKNSKLLIDPLTNYSIFLRNLKRTSEALKIESRIKLIK